MVEVGEADVIVAAYLDRIVRSLSGSEPVSPEGVTGLLVDQRWYSAKPTSTTFLRCSSQIEDKLSEAGAQGSRRVPAASGDDECGAAVGPELRAPPQSYDGRLWPSCGLRR